MTEFRLRIRGAGNEVVAEVELDCEDEQEALRTAVAVISPYGHDLFADERFVARFGRSWGEHLDTEEAEPDT